jgi:hypothetical protein
MLGVWVIRGWPRPSVLAVAVAAEGIEFIRSREPLPGRLGLFAWRTTEGRGQLYLALDLFLAILAKRFSALSGRIMDAMPR